MRMYIERSYVQSGRVRAWLRCKRASTLPIDKSRRWRTKVRTWRRFHDY